MSGTRCFVILVMLAAASPPAAGQQRVAIVSVSVLDPSAASVEAARRPEQTVIIEGERIVSVTPSATTAVPAGALVVDGRGGFVVPGFWDMHVHFNRDSLTQYHVMGPLMVANGVTSVRDMLSDCWEPCQAGRLTLAEMRALQQRTMETDVMIPRLQALSSPLVRGPASNGGYPREHPGFWRPSTAEEGRQLARFLFERGADLVKTYQEMARDAYFGLLEQAGELGLEVSGHLPWAVHPTEAARAGVGTIEHARWPGMACNPVYEEFRTMYAGVASGAGQWDGDVFGRFRDAVVPQFDAKLCAAILRELAANDVYLVPTLLTREMDARAGHAEYRNDPRRRYVPAWRLASWDRDLQGTADGPELLVKFYRDFFPLAVRITGMAHEAGVKIMVGTDAFDTMVFPGLSYHDELMHLRAAGLGPLAVLRAACYQGAEYLGKTNEFGTVAAGKTADLVLLDADPLLDIGNTSRIRAVVFRGRVLARDSLDAVLDGVATLVSRLR